MKLYELPEGYRKKNNEPISNSHTTFDKVVGIWSACPVDDGGMSDTILILLPDGTGLCGEANMGPYWPCHIIWSIDEDIFTVLNTESRCDSGVSCMYHDCFRYQESVKLEGLGEIIVYLPKIIGPYGIPFYLVSTEDDIQEREKSCRMYIDEIIREHIGGVL